MSFSSAYPDDLNPALSGGIATISRDEEIVFSIYVKYVLPLDGYVFWLRTSSVNIHGSLHYSSDSQQLVDENFTINRVVFSTTSDLGELVDFNDIDPKTILIGEHKGMRFAFSQRGFFYAAAKVYHYSGESVYPSVESQLVDVGDELSLDTLIVSNSLPAWLRIVDYSPIWLVGKNPGVTLYPSMLAPDNLRPPYGVVEIQPDQTRTLQAFPALGRTGTHSQLSTDHVRVILYGLTNDQALDWQDTVVEFSRDTNAIGMMSTSGLSVMRDDKKGQNEINALAMKKTIEYDVAYNQVRIRDVARQMVEEAAAILYVVDPVSPDL